MSEPALGMAGRNYVRRIRGVRIVVADSNRLDFAWLRRAVRAAPGDRWTIAVWHHPVYSPGTVHGSTPGMRPRLPRLLARAGVDLVLSGHDHVYAASEPLRGVRYVVTGGGGSRLYGCRPAWFAAACASRHHFVVVTARRRRLEVRAVPARGSALHSFSVAVRRR